MRVIMFDYFYGKQSEQFSFYRVPKDLFTNPAFKELSTEAKVLYGILLDRMNLSAKNGWMDKEGRVYIFFTIQEVMYAMNCADNKATKLLSELEDKAGLIVRKRQGLGKPDLIYVKNFIARDSRFKDRENHDSRIAEITIQESLKSRCNNTDINNTDLNDTESSSSLPLPSIPDENEETDYRETAKDYFRDALDFDVLLTDYPAEKETLEGILSLLVDICCSKEPYIRVAGEEKPAAVVKSRLMKLNEGDIRYVLQSLRDNTNKILAPTQYLTTLLYNAPVDKSVYYQAWVNHDMATGKMIKNDKREDE